MKFDKDRFERILGQIPALHLAVIGDLMVDTYVMGSVNRISPEAPVPIIALKEETSNLGGAANVAANIGSLGAKVTMFGLSGDDSEDELLRTLIQKQGFSDEGVITEAGRHTTVKTRVIAKNQHLLRIDRESTDNISDRSIEKLCEKFHSLAGNLDAVVLQDYNKGVLAPELIRKIIEISTENNVLIGVDPKHENYWEYKNAFLFKPNFREFEHSLGISISSDAELKKYGMSARDRLHVKYLLVTAGDRGMYLFDEKDVTHIPTKAHRVHDVSGAGDTVIATIMSALAAGADIQEAAALATWAASVVIAEVGAVPIDPTALREACLE